MSHAWLLKSEPGTYSFATLTADGRTAWTGIRNFAARNHLRAMAKGDLALFFHTGAEKAVVGLAKIASAPAPDPTAPGEDWSAVDLVPVKPLKVPVPLSLMKQTAGLAALPMLKQGRLSVSPVSKAELSLILRLGGTKP